MRGQEPARRVRITFPGRTGAAGAGALTKKQPFMFAFNKAQRIAAIFAAALLAFPFFQPNESPPPEIGSAVASLSAAKPARLAGLGLGDQLPAALVRRVRDVPQLVHASFLLFDFKQNLRRWPNVSGDISRSPPFLFAL